MCKKPDTLLKSSLGLEPIVFLLYRSIHGIEPTLSESIKSIAAGRTRIAKAKGL